VHKAESHDAHGNLPSLQRESSITALSYSCPELKSIKIGSPRRYSFPKEVQKAVDTPGKDIDHPRAKLPYAASSNDQYRKIYYRVAVAAGAKDCPGRHTPADSSERIAAIFDGAKENSMRLS
jgi:hypothetical protein